MRKNKFNLSVMRKIFFIFFYLFCLSNIFAYNSFDFQIYKAKKNFKIGYSHYQKGEYQLAIYYFQKSLENNSKYNISRIWLGKAYFQAGYIDNAIDEWNTVIELGAGDNILRQKLNYLQFSIGYPQKLDLIKDYSFYSSFYGTKLDRGKFLKPISILSTRDNFLFVVGFLSKNILKLNINGEVIRKYSLPLWKLKKPFGIAKDDMSFFYVSDFEKDVVYKFDSNFKKILSFGGSGITNSSFAGPEGLVVDHNNHILVVDNGNNRVQKFSSDGKFLMSFGKKGNGEGEFYRPCDIAIDKYGYIYVSDYGNRRIQKFDEDGNFIEVIGDGVLSSPRGIDIKDDLLIVANGKDGLFFYDIDKKIWWKKTYWNNGEFYFDNAIDVSFNENNNLLYVSDFDRNSIDVFMPEVFKYSDLYVDVSRIYLYQYPTVALKVIVNTRDGKFVSGLNEKNFSIKEDTIEINNISLLNFFDEKNSIVFLVDKSKSMENFEVELLNSADFVLKNLKENDRVKIVNVNDKVWVGNKYDYSRLRTLEKLKEKKFAEDFNISKALYQVITELNQVLNKKAIVLFTSGHYEKDFSFSDYSYDVVLHYAKNNNIPIFIISFSEDNRNDLENLAKDTGGEYFYYYTDSNKLKNIYDLIDKQIPKYYLLVYNSGRLKGFKKWRNVELNVNFQKLSGKDITGYFLP